MKNSEKKMFHDDSDSKRPQGCMTLEKTVFGFVFQSRKATVIEA